MGRRRAQSLSVRRGDLADQRPRCRDGQWSCRVGDANRAGTVVEQLLVGEQQQRIQSLVFEGWRAVRQSTGSWKLLPPSSSPDDKPGSYSATRTSVPLAMCSLGDYSGASCCSVGEMQPSTLGKYVFVWDSSARFTLVMASVCPVTRVAVNTSARPWMELCRGVASGGRRVA